MVTETTPPALPEAPPWEQMRDIINRLQEVSQKLDQIALLLQPKPETKAQGQGQGLRPKKEAYNVLEYRLDEARDQEEILWEGDNLTASTDGTLAGITVKFDSKHNDATPFHRFNPVFYPAGFKKFYLTTNVQEGKKLWLFIGRHAAVSTAPEITATAPRLIFYTIRSDKDDHFTGALAQYAKEDENLNGLLTSKIRILDVAIQAKQPLHFWLMFWRKDTFADTNLDEDAFIASVELDLSTFGNRVGGTGQYYMSREDINLDYEDEDVTRELHVSLYNADATSKSPGTAGEVVILIKYELRG